jgi:hypothetical protein
MNAIHQNGINQNVTSEWQENYILRDNIHQNDIQKHSAE